MTTAQFFFAIPSALFFLAMVPFAFAWAFTFNWHYLAASGVCFVFWNLFAYVVKNTQ